MSKEIENSLKNLTKVENNNALLYEDMKKKFDENFPGALQEADEAFEKRFDVLNDVSVNFLNSDEVNEQQKKLEEAIKKLEEKIEAENAENKEEYLEQLNALKEQHNKNKENYDAFKQDYTDKMHTDEMQSKMEKAAVKKLDEGLEAFGETYRTNLEKLLDINNQLDVVLKHNNAAFNPEFWSEYEALQSKMNQLNLKDPGKDLKNLESYIQTNTNGKPDPEKESLKKGYDDRLNSLQDVQGKFKEDYGETRQRYMLMEATKNWFTYRFNNIVDGANLRLWNSDNEVAEKKNSNEYKEMRTAIRNMVDTDGGLKEFNSPEEEKAACKAAYDACQKYVKVKKDKTSRLFGNGSRRLSAAEDMMQALSARYPEFKQQKKEKSSKKEVEKVRTSFLELSQKYEKRSIERHKRTEKEMNKLNKMNKGRGM